MTIKPAIACTNLSHGSWPRNTVTLMGCRNLLPRSESSLHQMRTLHGICVQRLEANFNNLINRAFEGRPCLGASGVRPFKGHGNGLQRQSRPHQTHEDALTATIAEAYQRGISRPFRCAVRRAHAVHLIVVGYLPLLSGSLCTSEIPSVDH